ncbi:teichoic acids export ABC transporter ATP-binding subunit TagH [Mesobacillus subterraneus]|uniref:Teichoic acids export ABC transporter ATP-binding subunit TagH n=1 Tax=Mesobacillus subterraneus TaxID=285983 RepID=A0A3R9DQW3_9BACI|nr:teichoic acids export ABC transporter ATP-binding subunit TagH [Mesobacillus subterraneus]RSD25216.1 teichoic acids export ABC transporter ATP-binding subunit TagH [Mesobacillus subterraneus]
MNKSVIVKNVSKKYKLYKSTSERLLDVLLPKSYGEDFYALRNISFEADEGDVVGFLGINGSGKSTLSNIIAGIVPPTDGEVDVKGQTALIAVASGLNNELSGRDNIELKLLMLGFGKSEIKQLEPEIIEFSELGKFIDQPVKSYSSGMKSKLGFAISVNIDPDVLIIDEALSVGDKAFAEKSLNKMKEFKERGKTMFFVSHSIGQMKQFCEKIVWLEFGQLKMYGTVDEVVPEYEKFLKEYKAMSKKEQKQYRERSLERQSQLDVT